MEWEDFPWERFLHKEGPKSNRKTIGQTYLLLQSNHVLQLQLPMVHLENYIYNFNQKASINAYLIISSSLVISVIENNKIETK